MNPNNHPSATVLSNNLNAVGSSDFFDDDSSDYHAVARDLVTALTTRDPEECRYYDLQLIGSSGSTGGCRSNTEKDDVEDDDNENNGNNNVVVVQGVPAIRFVLAARSAVFRKMLYGEFSESKQPSIRFNYSNQTLSAIVHFCHYNVIPPTLLLQQQHNRTRQERQRPPAPAPLPSSNNNNIQRRRCSSSSNHHHHFNNNDDDGMDWLIDNIQSLVELCHAADFFALSRLYDLAHDYVTHQMTRYPFLAGIVVEATTMMTTTNSNSSSSSRSSSNLDDDGTAGTGHDGGGCSLAQTAMQIIECRPYVALHPRTIGYLSGSTLQYVLQNNTIGAGEWFLLQVLLGWHKAQQQLYQQSPPPDNNNNAAATAPTSVSIMARDICQSCIKLSYIEPAQLLSLLAGTDSSSSSSSSCCRRDDDSTIVPKDFIFDAIAKQALKASKFKVWRLDCRGRNVNDDRVLVEGAGTTDVNGLYYRLNTTASSFFTTASSSPSNSKNDLYVKRELAGGQCYVYTLSRRLRVVASSSSSSCFGGVGSTTTAAEQHPVPQPPQRKSNNSVLYECRIFRNKFLTHQAVRKLHMMQLDGTVQPSFQPILQILHVEGPCGGNNHHHHNSNTTTATAVTNSSDTTTIGGGTTTAHLYRSNNNVPTPIRRFHRVRLSDGDHSLPGTLADNVIISHHSHSDQQQPQQTPPQQQQRFTAQYQVIQVLEFGLYTIYNGRDGGGGVEGGHVGIHVIRAKILASGPLLRFGNPRPLPTLDRPIVDAGTAVSDTDDGCVDSDPTTNHPAAAAASASSSDHATFYTVVFDVPPPSDHTQHLVVRVPKGGWRREGSGRDPPPECTYIPSSSNLVQQREPNDDE